MNDLFKVIFILLTGLFIQACEQTDMTDHASHAHHHNHHDDYIKGPHGGRLLSKDGFSLELKIDHVGKTAKFLAWMTYNNQTISIEQADLQIKLIRLGGIKEVIQFQAMGDSLKSDVAVNEPHSFVVHAEASYQGKTYLWQFDHFEGRTTIPAEIAQNFNLQTSMAGPQKIQQKTTLYGKIVNKPDKQNKVSARFEGVIQSVHVSLGDTVKKGQMLAKIESNESLNTYTLRAPINGVITEQVANAKEQTNGRRLFTITDTSVVWAELDIFPSDREHIKNGANVTLIPTTGEQSYVSEISFIDVITKSNQAVTARVALINNHQQLLPGMHVTGEVKVAEYTVPLAVKRSAIQRVQDKPVVYVNMNDIYETRRLQLGRQDDEWVEVLSGLKPGTHYVSQNSYLIKADIEKASVAHDH